MVLHIRMVDDDICGTSRRCWHPTGGHQVWKVAHRLHPSMLGWVGAWDGRALHSTRTNGVCLATSNHHQSSDSTQDRFQMDSSRPLPGTQSRELSRRDLRVDAFERMAIQMGRSCCNKDSMIDSMIQRFMPLPWLVIFKVTPVALIVAPSRLSRERAQTASSRPWEGCCSSL